MTQIIRRIILALALMAGIAPAMAQAPSPVPALPDSERRTSYSISGTTCICAVGFQLYGDSTDYANWLQVWVNGVQISQSGNWTVTSPTGPLATIPRPITDAVLTFTAAQTGTVQIVGARRPRRLSQFAENRGVAARDLNQAVTDLVAENREQWDALIRTMTAPPGDTQVPLVLPSASARASKFLGFDANGGVAVFTPGAGSGGNVTGPVSSTNNDFACFNGTTGQVIKDCAVGLPISLGNGGTGQTTAPTARGSSGLNIDQYTAHGDSIYTILSTDRTVGTSATLTAPRIWTLPAANSVNPGQTILVADFFGGVTNTNTLTIQRAGSDTISVSPGGATSVAISIAFGRYEFRSDGVSKWSATAIATTSSGQLVSILNYGAKCDGATDDSTVMQTWFNALPTAGKGIIPAGLTCLYTGIITVPSKAYWEMYGATLKAKNSAASNTCICFSQSDQLSTGPSFAGVFGGTVDGNNANRTGSGGAGAIYLVAATDIIIRDVKVINSHTGTDCIGVGGDTTHGLSGRVRIENVTTDVCRRNGLALFGANVISIVRSKFNGAITAPGHGIDIEPDTLSNPDANITIDDVAVTANGGCGISVNSAAVAGAAVTTSQAINVTASGNGGAADFCQYTTAATKAGFRFINVHGTFGGSLPAVDALP